MITALLRDAERNSYRRRQRRRALLARQESQLLIVIMFVLGFFIGLIAANLPW